MAGRLTSALCYCLIIQVTFVINSYNCRTFEEKAKTLHIRADGENSRKPVIIERAIDDGEEMSFDRKRRDAPPHHNNPNIVTKINALNDSHQQLMVHWVGEGSNVIICLARDSTPVSRSLTIKIPSLLSSPSAVYISYDYGDTFKNKTELFKIVVGNETKYATLDKFTNHPNFHDHCVFLDSTNGYIFVTKNNGETITPISVPFHPSEISFSEQHPSYLVALDKVDPNRKLWLSSDGGISWKVIDSYVKAFFWSTSNSSNLLFEQTEPSGTNTVLKTNIISVYNNGKTFENDTLYSSMRKYLVVIERVEDFQIRGDYMFATSRNERTKDLDLWISHKEGPFVHAAFNTEFETKEYHIADVSENRVFVAVSHGENIVNLYVSEVIDSQKAVFTLSLEGILTFFPNNTWKGSWLNEVADEAFTDLYKVEGIHGIYIGSRVKAAPKSSSIGPEHLVSLITFDHGVTWNEIKPPVANSEGYYLHCANDCALHLSQRFSHLYPVTRSVTIMSSKSAPGIIMATGVIGPNLKGHPALYVSKNAGLNWKQVLKDYYFFNMGDHGGILVAVKYFKLRGETRDISYSIDHGETWQTYQFNEKMLRVYGLMTEPGENTTVFTMFGSGSGRHQWLIIKIDLRKVFEKDCTADDFKFWSPTSSDQPVLACILGKKETYKRRATQGNCYTGVNYDRPVKMEICPCDANDYQCDTGFVRVRNPFHCIRNKLDSVDPYAVPYTCTPGSFYNRTKGYSKIPNDECFGGLARNFEPDEIPCPMTEMREFLLVAQRDQISRIDLVEEKLDILPVHGLKNVIAIEFDLKNNCLYWADIVNDTIGRQCLQNGTSFPEILVETDLSSIEGMAFDWVSNVLYFVDGVKMRIQIIRTDLSSQGRMRRTILGSNNLQKPRGVAVHPMRGYMFWTDWAPGNASVSRANLDGTDIKRLFVKPMVEWPNGITIDHVAERIYWVDAREDYIGASDFDGKRFKKIIAHDERVSHPFAVAVFKDNMYWDDWKLSMIFVADKDHGVGTTTIIGQLSGLMDLKVFAHSIQSGTNKCANSTCSHICLGAPNDNYVCLCPDGMVMENGKCMCPGGITPFANSTCPRQANTCMTNQFACNNDLCIPEFWECDGDNDCGDNSDELHCKKATCSPISFECGDGKCIPKYWVCDLDKDCKDGKDEINCTYTNCTDAQFKCDNGRCISHRWRCDKEDDCRDGSDERNCTTGVEPSTCEPDEIRCHYENTCIPMTWKCDGDVDCDDGLDEKDCSTMECEIWQFACNASSQTHRCIYESWRCDGDKDCPYGSDEVNCTVTTPLPPPPPIAPTNSCNDWMFMCQNKKCVPYWWKCDGVNDCGDESDELGCGNPISPFPPIDEITTTTTEKSTTCIEHQFRCWNGDCIEHSWVCDGTSDCVSGEDEIHCDPKHMKCGDDQFTCRKDGSCVLLTNMCNGIEECPDGSDELGCYIHPVQPPPPCEDGMFSCDETYCIPIVSRCDGTPDCLDGSDENNCDKNHGRVYQIVGLDVDKRSINSTSFFLSWWMFPSGNLTLQYLPSISKVEPNAKWTNVSQWIEEAEYQFTDLQPFARYNLTVYVRVKGQNVTAPPAKFITVSTNEGVPSEPWDVKVVQKNGTKVEISWQPPLLPHGIITGYTVSITPPTPPLRISETKTSTICDFPFEAEKSYSFSVVAKNRQYISGSSNTVTFTFDGSGNIDDIKNLRVIQTTAHSVALAWTRVTGADGYHVTPRGPAPYPALRTVTTTNNQLNVTNLAPGINYTFEVSATKKTYVGKAGVVIGATKGTPLPSIVKPFVQLVKYHGTTVKLTWNPPKDPRKIKWQYAIHYALNLPDFFRDYKLLTTNLAATIKDLEACESYFFAVGIRGDEYGAGPLSEPVFMPTHYNPTAPPKRVRVTSTEKSDTIVVFWSASCATIEEPISYTITLTELVLNKGMVATLPATNETIMKHTFSGIKFGGKYRITVATDVENAIPSQPVIYSAPPISSPYELNAVRHEDGVYLLHWQKGLVPESIIKDTEYHYEIFMAEGSRTINESTAKVFKANQSPLIFDKAKTDVIYTFAVKLVTEEGYQSQLSTKCSFENPAEKAWPVTINPSNILSLAIPICLLIVAMGSALAYFIIRHRRLSNSFTQFANSHYDTRRGQATFPGTTDGLEEEDSPIIRGFSDDEPLVIA